MLFRSLEARDDLAEQGIAMDYLRVRGFPFNETVERFLAEHDRVVVIEQNRDEQLRKLITIETGCPQEKPRSITYYGGQPLSKGHVLDGLAEWIPELASGAVRGDASPEPHGSGGDPEPDPATAEATS